MSENSDLSKRQTFKNRRPVVLSEDCLLCPQAFSSLPKVVFCSTVDRIRDNCASKSKSYANVALSIT